jgi:PPOX class probable F420-dependent enzyme
VADYYLVEEARGPGWDHSRTRREQAGWDEHGAFMDALVAEGFVVLGGPMGDGDGDSALLVVDAPDAAAVRARLEADPWIANATLTIASVVPWSVWLRGGAKGTSRDGPAAVALNDATRALLDARPFAVLTTINPDGGPQSSVVWLERDGDEILFTTLRERRKGRNLARDPRLSLVLVDPEDPYRFVEIRGRATLTDDPENALGHKLTRAYLGQPAPDDPPGTRRVVVRVTPMRLTGPAAREGA